MKVTPTKMALAFAVALTANPLSGCAPLEEPTPVAAPDPGAIAQRTLDSAIRRAEWEAQWQINNKVGEAIGSFFD